MGEFSMYCAVVDGDWKRVRELIDLGVNINSPNIHGETPLIVAARGGHVEIFDLLIQSGAQVNCGRDSDGWTPLHWASWRNLVDQVRLILEKGNVDLNAATNNGKTPLMIAASGGHRDIFDLLIQSGARVNCGADSAGWTVLHWACSEGWVEQVRLILEKRSVDLNAATNDGETPLILAASRERKEIFYLLIQHGAQVNCRTFCNGWTPLHYACHNGWVDQVQLILEKGFADLNAADINGETSLIMAVRGGHIEIFNLLFQYGALVSKRDNYGWTALHWACAKGWVDQVRHILEKGGTDLNAAGKNDGETPLLVAAGRGDIEIFDLLIQSGARVNCLRDRYGFTTFHWACARGWVDQVRLILEKGGSDLMNDATKHGKTPLELALEGGHREIFILLFQYGAIMDIDYDLISKHSFLEVVFKDVNQCAQLIANKFYCQSLPTLYRNPDIAKKLPSLKNFNLKNQQMQEIAKFVDSEVKTKKFCNVFSSKPIVLMILCVQSLISHQSTRKMSASSDSNLPFKKPRFN